MVGGRATSEEVGAAGPDVDRLDAVVDEELVEGLHQAGATVGGRGVLYFCEEMLSRVTLGLTRDAVLLQEHGISNLGS